jgi:hypothetical protein
MNTAVPEALVEQVPPSSLGAALIRHPVVAFFILAYAGSWVTFLPIVLGQNGIGVAPYTLPDGVTFVLFVRHVDERRLGQRDHIRDRRVRAYSRHARTTIICVTEGTGQRVSGRLLQSRLLMGCWLKESESP